MKKMLKQWKRRRKIRRERPKLLEIPSEKLGYIQIPKVATRSIRASLTAKYLNEVTSEHLSEEKIKEVIAEIGTYDTYDNIVKRKEDLTIFAVVRNPYQRIISCYENKIINAQKKGKRNVLEVNGVTFDDTLESFIRKIANVPDSEADRHFRSQTWFLSHQGKLIPDYILHLEKMNEEWQELKERFNLPALPHRNKSVKKKKKTELSKELIDIIAKRYADDFKNFDYSLEY